MESYQQIPSPRATRLDEDATAKGPVELVTVPALGAEWGKNELKAMTKKGRKEDKSEDFGRKWKAFNRGQYGLFGRKWLTRRTVVFFVFGLCAAYVFPPRTTRIRLCLPTSVLQYRNHPCVCHPTRTQLRHLRVEPSYIRHRLV